MAFTAKLQVHVHNYKYTLIYYDQSCIHVIYDVYTYDIRVDPIQHSMHTQIHMQIIIVHFSLVRVTEATLRYFDPGFRIVEIGRAHV